MIEIAFNNAAYGVALAFDALHLTVRRSRKGALYKVTVPPDEKEAQMWLGDHGLNARLARRLLDAEIRKEGPLANPKHPRRKAA